ncbi:MAG TPA: prolyl oligopeptidase family serine peptidase [Terriglobales bacterium]|nr:prolyl oligopeptidase family serine peptidase [Terriglobales bacterium]
MQMYRTRFSRDILTEFLPPARPGKKRTGRVIILCDGMPSIPRKQPLAEFLAVKGYWVFYPRYRGAWESGGEFLKRSPHLDILDVIDGLSKDFRELAFGRRFRLSLDELFVVGGSFGGAAAILSSLDPRVKKVVANCPVVDWSILAREQRKETSNPSYAAYIRAAFGHAYRLSDKNWKKLFDGKFYNPLYHARQITASKVMMFHAQDDPYVPYRSVQKFARLTGVQLKLLRRGGHLSTDLIIRKYWTEIKTFFVR